jgi:hypothetical protein
MLVCIVAVLELAVLDLAVLDLAVLDLAVLDLGASAPGHVDRASGSGARVVGDQGVDGDAGGIWEAIEEVFAGWHAAGERSGRRSGSASTGRGGSGCRYGGRTAGARIRTARRRIDPPAGAAPRPDAVVEVDGPAAERPLVHQLQPDASVFGEGTRPTAHDDGNEEEMALVDQAGPDRLARELGPANAEVAVGGRLDPAYRFGVEVSLDPRPSCGSGLQRRRHRDDPPVTAHREPHGPR